MNRTMSMPRQCHEAPEDSLTHIQSNESENVAEGFGRKYHVCVVGGALTSKAAKK